MKAIAEARKVLEVKLSSLMDDKRKIDAEVYKLNMAIEKLDSINGLVRINRQTHTKKCVVCGNDFKAKKANAIYCSNKCNKKAYTKGVKLIEGATK